MSTKCHIHTITHTCTTSSTVDTPWRGGMFVSESTLIHHHQKSICYVRVHSCWIYIFICWFLWLYFFFTPPLSSPSVPYSPLSDTLPCDSSCLTSLSGNFVLLSFTQGDCWILSAFSSLLETFSFLQPGNFLQVLKLGSCRSHLFIFLSEITVLHRLLSNAWKQLFVFYCGSGV